MEKMDWQNSQSKGEHYNLRWTNYHNNLSQIVFEHHLNERLVDVTLVCEGQYIKAHKLVLSACSNFFQDMFKMNNSLDQLFVHPFIVMNGVQFNYLKHIIDFMYQGEIKVVDSDLEGVLALGETLRVKGLCSVKLRQKVGLGEPRTLERSNSPSPKQISPAESKKSSDNLQKGPVVSLTSNSLSYEDVNVNTTKEMNASQEEPKNYSKVSLDALSENAALTQNVNNGTKNELKNDEKRLREPCLTGQPIKLKYKKLKVNPPPPLIIRKNVIKPISPSSSPKLKSPLKEGKPEQIVNDKPIIIDAELGDVEKKNEIPRPPNAFMIFATEMRKKLAVEHPKESSKDISIRLGNLWKSLCTETREVYYKAAQTALHEHELKYPQKKIYVASFAKTKSSGPSNDSHNQQDDDDDDDLEIIEPPDAIRTITSNAN